jgi:hypothetical protein
VPWLAPQAARLGSNVAPGPSARHPSSAVLKGSAKNATRLTRKAHPAGSLLPAPKGRHPPLLLCKCSFENHRARLCRMRARARPTRASLATNRSEGYLRISKNVAPATVAPLRRPAAARYGMDRHPECKRRISLTISMRSLPAVCGGNEGCRAEGPGATFKPKPKALRKPAAARLSELSKAFVCRSGGQ